MPQAAGDHLHCRGAASSDRGADGAANSVTGPVPNTESSSSAPGSRGSFCPNDSDAGALYTGSAVDAIHQRGYSEHSAQAE
jgi:hypothetical protein